MSKIIRKPLTLLLCIAFLASCIRTSYALRPMAGILSPYTPSISLENMTEQRLDALDVLWRITAEEFNKEGAATEVLKYIGNSLLLAPEGNLTVLNLLFTYRCFMRCEMCYMKEIVAQNGDLDMPIELLQRISKQLHNFEEVYITGGEPFAYGKMTYDSLKPEEVFWQALQILADEVAAVTINTGGYWLTDMSVAHEIAQRLPENVRLVISIDPEHEDALKRRFGIGYAQIDVKKRLTEAGFKIGKNVFFSGRETYGERKGTKIKQFFNEIGLGDEYPDLARHPKVAVSKIFTNGAAGHIEISNRVRTLDFALDYLMAELPSQMFLFITPEGKVTINSYAAAQLEIPEFCILGDINHKPLSQIFFEGILGRFVSFKDYPDLYMLYLFGYMNYNPINWYEEDIFYFAYDLHCRLKEQYGLRGFTGFFETIRCVLEQNIDWGITMRHCYVVLGTMYAHGCALSVRPEIVKRKIEMCDGEKIPGCAPEKVPSAVSTLEEAVLIYGSALRNKNVDRLSSWNPGDIPFKRHTGYKQLLRRLRKYPQNVAYASLAHEYAVGLWRLQQVFDYADTLNRKVKEQTATITESRPLSLKETDHAIGTAA